MCNSHFYTSEYNPENIEQNGARLVTEDDFLTEGEEAETSEFEALQTYRNADNCQTPQKTYNEPAEACQNTTKQKPDDVADDAHRTLPPLNKIMIISSL